MKISSNALPKNLSPEESEWVYNGLDCAATMLAWHGMQKQASKENLISYSFVSGMRAPALEMTLRGMKIDLECKAQFIKKFSEQKQRLQGILDRLTCAVWDRPLNTASPKQMVEFFYTCMNLPKQYKFSKGKRSLTADREALEKLRFNFFAQPIINTVLAIREVDKKLQFLKGGIDADQRFRASFNVVGTETGRWSSSENPFGTGSNMQNITNELRQIFIADAGKKIAYVDKDQAESRAVAYISGDKGYIEACLSGDLHTTVARMVWKDLPWTGDNKEDRKMADRPFYRHFSYRDMAKRGGHGTNYYGSPRTMAKHLKVTEELMKGFQDAYFTAFPGLREWHHRVARQIQTQGFLTTALGRKRHFLGRRFDENTLREAIAFEPQSIVGELLNLFLWRVWKYEPRVQVLAQIHDAILFQYQAELEREVLENIHRLGRTEVPFPAGIMVIPTSAEVGWNWAKATDENPHGLRKYKGDDTRTPPTYRGILDWQVL